MKLYNTLTRTLQEFEPLNPPNVTMYVCGPTVYDDPHIGHARSAFTFDLLRRYLRFRNYRVTFVRNVTDVDDKIIDRARQGNPADLKAACREVAEKYLASYHAAMDTMGIERPDREPKATDHVVPDPKNVELTGNIDASMTGYISRLLTQGVAYPGGGDVYYAVRKSADYGRLSNRSVEELQSGARVEPGEQKQDPLDFALWKAAKPGEPSWPSPWGAGRPGWHIECTVMSTTYLGDAFDIHGGGVDLVFPHHENELAQARGLGKPFANYWVHNGLLTVKGEKMSKSLGNFTTFQDALKGAEGEPDALKVFFLGAHYRSPIDYSQASVRAAVTRYRNIVAFLDRVHNFCETLPAAPAAPGNPFEAAMDDDLNSPGALGAIESAINGVHQAPDWRAAAPGAAATVKSWCQALGLLTDYRPITLSESQQKRVGEREAARKQKDYQAADAIRNEFAAAGLALEDTASGPVVRRKR